MTYLPVKERKIKYEGESGEKCHSYLIFDDTEVSEGGWMIGRKWMNAKHLNSCVARWVSRSYDTRADKQLSNTKLSKHLRQQLQEIHNEYDLGAGCGQCGGCRWFAALDADYGFCCNEDSSNEGRITFEHGGCIQHSFIQELLSKKQKEKVNVH